MPSWMRDGRGWLCFLLAPLALAPLGEDGRRALADGLARHRAPHDVEAGRNIEHQVEHGFFEDGPKPASAGAALHRRARDGTEGVVGELQLDALHLEELLILLGDRVLGL